MRIFCTYPWLINIFHTMKTRSIFCLLAISISIFSGCKKDNPDPISNKIKIAESTAPEGLKATLWSDNEKLSVGFNVVYITLSDASGDIKGLPVTISPVMDMGMMQHGCPVEQPVYDTENGFYTGAIAFNMASTATETWQLKIEVDGRTVSLNITVESTAPTTKHITNVTGTDSAVYVISLVEPLSPKTGMNNLEILINKREGMFSYPSVNDFSVEFRPEMTSMGHGSPNNVNPENHGNGRYKGKVNYTMTGDWRLFFTLKRNGNTIAETYLDILF